ncbi:MAG: hypothetical protein FJW40_20880 [Acidobacteria bacterium]|nr:hypothetical protein [Acidobacteriota bacterium]
MFRFYYSRDSRPGAAPILSSGDLAAFLLDFIHTIPEPGEQIHLDWFFDTPITPGQDHALRLPILANFGLQAAPLDAPMRGAARFSIAAAAGATWLDAPQIGTSFHRRPAKRVSTDSQRALRRWLPAAWYSDSKRLRSVDEFHGVLVYQNSTPHVAASDCRYTYDLLGGSTTRLLFHRAMPRMQRRLIELRPLLEEAHLRPLYVRADEEDAQSIVDSVRNRRRILDRLVAAEGDLVPELIRLTGTARRSYRPERMVNDVAATIHGRLRRILGSFDFSPIAPAVVLECSVALATLLNRPFRVQAQAVPPADVLPGGVPRAA